MAEKFSIFETKFNNDELEEEFTNFFYKYNLTSIFTNEHRAGGITVTYVDAKSVINTGGSYHETLKEFSDFLSMANDNKSYEEALFKLIYDSSSFQAFIKNIRKYMDFIKQQIDSEHMSNMWNIVWYAQELK